MSSDLILTGLYQSLIFAFVAYGVMIPFKLLNLPDLSSEGSFPLGGAISASLIILGVNPILAIVIAALLGGLVGIATALINLNLKINSLLAGIIVSTMAYSINLRIMGKPNLSLFNLPSIFSPANYYYNLCILIVILLLFIIPFLYFLKTEKGLRFRAVGLNQFFASKQNISISKYITLGFFIANFYSSLAGSIMVQFQSYMDIGMGIGIVIHALAALMIGEALINCNTISRQLAAPIIGSLIYQQIQGFALALGLVPTDLKFITGLIVLGLLSLKKFAKT